MVPGRKKGKVVHTKDASLAVKKDRASLIPSDDREVEIVPEEEIELEEEEVVLESDAVVEEKGKDIVEQLTPKSSSTSVATYDPLTAYIQQIRRYPLLSPEEEHELAVKYQEHGDDSAAKKLITSNLRLVVKIAHEYSAAHHNLLDLIQEGNLGLIQAVRKFDPYKGVKLSTYSSWWIRAYILKYLLNNWRLVKIGTTQNQRKLFFNLHKQAEALKAKGIIPTTKALAESLDVSEKEVSEMQQRLGSTDLSLAAPVGDEDGKRTVQDILGSGDPTPEEEASREELRALIREKISEFVQTLHGRDLVIMRERILSDNPLTLKEIGDRYGITRERARQLEKRIYKKLRQYLEQELGDKVKIALGLEK